MFKNSEGPYLQSEEIINELENAASTNTKPGASHNELKTKQLAWIKNLLKKKF